MDILLKNQNVTMYLTMLVGYDAKLDIPLKVIAFGYARPMEHGLAEVHHAKVRSK